MSIRRFYAICKFDRLKAMSEEKVKVKLPADLFKGQTAIVTGGSRGVGKATALRLAEAGANVVINFLKEREKAEEVVRECQLNGVGAIAVKGNSAHLEDALNIARIAVETFGAVQLLVINAGIWKGAPIEQMDEDIWDEVLDTNLKSAWAMSKACVPEMKRATKGSIVLVSSTAGQRGEAFYSCYAASKGGQISFTKSLAVELAPNIRVNAVAPGWIETAMVRPVFDDENYKRQVINSIPLKRVATADDIALSICFLLSDWARHITGEILNINGGAVLCG